MILRSWPAGSWCFWSSWFPLSQSSSTTSLQSRSRHSRYQWQSPGWIPVTLHCSWLWSCARWWQGYCTTIDRYRDQVRNLLCMRLLHIMCWSSQKGYVSIYQKRIHNIPYHAICWTIHMYLHTYSLYRIYTIYVHQKYMYNYMYRFKHMYVRVNTTHLWSCNRSGQSSRREKMSDFRPAAWRLCYLPGRELGGNTVATNCVTNKLANDNYHWYWIIGLSNYQI